MSKLRILSLFFLLPALFTVNGCEKDYDGFNKIFYKLPRTVIFRDDMNDLNLWKVDTTFGYPNFSHPCPNQTIKDNNFEFGLLKLIPVFINSNGRYEELILIATRQLPEINIKSNKVYGVEIHFKEFLLQKGAGVSLETNQIRLSFNNMALISDGSDYDLDLDNETLHFSFTLNRVHSVITEVSKDDDEAITVPDHPLLAVSPNKLEFRASYNLDMSRSSCDITSAIVDYVEIYEILNMSN